MMAARQNYIYTGNPDEIPQTATHIRIHESIKIIEDDPFFAHPSIIELFCHMGVIKILDLSFHSCPHLKRLVLPGVEEIDGATFGECYELEYVECDKVEQIGEYTFQNCTSLGGVHLPSIKRIRMQAFDGCTAITDAKFGKDLERIDSWAFTGCRSLERITLPLKRDLFNDSVFAGCENLKHLDLVEGDILRETIEALHLESWRSDVNRRVQSINDELPFLSAGERLDEESNDENDGGDKAMHISIWIAAVLITIIDYKKEHRDLLNSATAILQSVLPNDIVMNNVIPFLNLPLYKFDGED